MRSTAIVAGTQESLRGELATRLSPGALDGRMMCTKNGVLSKFDLLAGELAENQGGLNGSLQHWLGV
jgi:hypothetical protein